MFKTMPGAFIELFKGRFDYFYKALQLALPPRLLFPGIVLLGAIVLGAFGLNHFSAIWMGLFFCIVLAYSVAIPKRFWGVRMLENVFALMKAFKLTLFSVVKIGSANKKFIHTPHLGSEIAGVDESLTNKN